MNKNLKIVSTGIYIPENKKKSSELDKLFNLPAGTVAAKSGVKTRHYATSEETAPFMGAKALEQALKNKELNLKDLDLIIGASGTCAQIIPSNAALIKAQLDSKHQTSIACFDVNSTCLSFVTALDLASYLIDSNNYKRIAIVSSERVSVGLNFDEIESASLMGDGASAVIVEVSQENESYITTSLMETFTEGIEDAQVKAGGTNLSPSFIDGIDKKEFCFTMQGPQIFKLVSKKMPAFCEKLFKQAQMTMDDIDMVIPHQASIMAIKLLQKKLAVSDKKIHLTLSKYGNNVAASIPICLHDALENKKIKRGDNILLLGTSAGMSIGAMVLRY